MTPQEKTLLALTIRDAMIRSYQLGAQDSGSDRSEKDIGDILGNDPIIRQLFTEGPFS